MLDRGNQFIDKIHRSNDAIPGEEISAKISRMELIVRKIFERVQEHPEVIPDLKRLMDYYLPTTVKLLDAYEDMDSQPVQGENIQNSKFEIEKTIDTLNTAFEKLLDSIFEDTAMDVSSDISVLHTVLAQEGLTEDEFTDRISAIIVLRFIIFSSFFRISGRTMHKNSGHISATAMLLINTFVPFVRCFSLFAEVYRQ